MGRAFNPVDWIRAKRDGKKHDPREMRRFIEAYGKGEIADYQMSAWLMAALLQGLDRDETVALTEAMLSSGRVLRLRSVRGRKVDKHSTGGVGDKISICLAPLVAACGVPVPMISGRGLGHTGGTLDKLEAIPGYRVRQTVARFERIVREVGTSLIGQTSELAPADRRIYALRDVTATVESIPLIVASILSKKLAEGIDGLVLDVKVGRGAFMKDAAQARELARTLVAVGTRAGKDVVALLTDMTTPIGRTIGNALETREAIEILRNEGPADTRELTLALGTEMLLLGRAARSPREARQKLETALQSGAAFERFLRLVKAHGGDTRAVENTDRLPTARVKLAVSSQRSGFVADCDAYALALAALELGAGRTRADQKIDHAAGIELCAVHGEAVERGAPLAVIHAATPNAAKTQAKRVAAAFTLSSKRPPANSRILERITR